MAFERNAFDKHEYYKEIFLMSGASFRHNLIESNLRLLLGNYLKGKQCREFGSNLKFELYRDINTLNEYVLICSKTIHAVVYAKNNNGTWTLSETKNLGDHMLLPSINYNIPIADIYEGIDKVNR